MNKFTKIIGLSLIAMGMLSVCSATLSADDNRGRNMPAFESFDLNEDGAISESELKEAREKRVEEKKAQGRLLRNTKDRPSFKDIDLDGDCEITEEEFAKHQKKMRQ